MTDPQDTIQDTAPSVGTEPTFTVTDSTPQPIPETATSETTPIGDATEGDVRVEEFKISGGELVARVKDFIHQGTIRRIIIKNEEGNALIEIPLTVGVVGGVIGATMFPVIAALGAIGALVAHLTIVIEKKVDG